MSNTEEVINSSATADGTAHDRIEDFLTSSDYEDSDNDSEYCTSIHDDLVILSTKDDEEAMNVLVTFTVGKYPNAKKYTDNIDTMLKDIRENPSDYDSDVGWIFTNAKNEHMRLLGHDNNYPYGNDVDTRTFTLATALTLGLVTVNPQNNKANVNTVDCANYITNHLYTIILRDTGEMFIYSNGVYIQGAEAFIKEAIHDLLETEWTTHREKEIIGYIKASHKIARTDTLDDTDEVCLQNGLVNMVTGKWTPHDHKKIHLTQLPFGYDPSAPEPTFHKYLIEACYPIDPTMTREEKEKELELRVRCIYEWFAFLLEPGYKTKKMLILHGPHDTFKSVCLNVMAAFVGQDLSSGKDLSELCNGDKFANHALYGRWFNNSPEFDKQSLKSVNFIKSWTGGDKRQCEGKGKNSFPFYPRAKLAAGTNDLPALPDTDPDSFFSRLLFLPFQNQVPADKIDVDLTKKLTIDSELTGIFNIALQAHLERYKRNGRAFSYTQAPEDIQQYYEDFTNQFETALDALYDVIAPGEYDDWKMRTGNRTYPYTPASDVYNAVKNYWAKKGFNVNKKKGYKKLVQDYYSGIVRLEKPSYSGYVEVFIGLVPKNENPQGLFDEKFNVEADPSIKHMKDVVQAEIQKGKCSLKELAESDEVAYTFAKTLIALKKLEEYNGTKILRWVK